MKKVFTLLIAVVASIMLIGCNDNSEFKVDGKFTAYEVSVHSNAPQVTYVTVTIENGQIVKYDIDVRQGVDEQTDTGYSFTWNQLTKKQLGDDYNMKLYGTKYDLVDGEWVEVEGEKPEYEWYEQVNLIENYLLDNGVDSVQVIDERVSNVAGVTIKEDSYIDLAADAVELAKIGKFQAIYCSSDDLYIASMTYDKNGNISDLTLDVLQGKPNGENFAWSESTKQELGEEYGMEGLGSAFDYIDGEWVESDEKTVLEWYEQANLITDYIEANGFDENLEALAGRGGTIDGTTLLDDLAGVTIRTQTYYDVLTALFEKTN